MRVSRVLITNTLCCGIAASGVIGLFHALAPVPAKPPKQVPPRAINHLEPGQKCEAFNELDVWVFRADREKWTVDELATSFPIIKTGTELEVVEDAGDIGEWRGEWRLIRVRDHRSKLRLDVRDGHFAPGEYVDHEFCVQRCDLRAKP